MGGGVASAAWLVPDELVPTWCCEKRAGLEAHSVSSSVVTNQLSSLEQVSHPLGLSFPN